MCFRGLRSRPTYTKRNPGKKRSESSKPVKSRVRYCRVIIEQEKTSVLPARRDESQQQAVPYPVESNHMNTSQQPEGDFMSWLYRLSTSKILREYQREDRPLRELLAHCSLRDNVLDFFAHEAISHEHHMQLQTTHVSAAHMASSQLDTGWMIEDSIWAEITMEKASREVTLVVAELDDDDDDDDPNTSEVEREEATDAEASHGSESDDSADADEWHDFECDSSATDDYDDVVAHQTEHGVCFDRQEPRQILRYSSHLASDLREQLLLETC